MESLIGHISGYAVPVYAVDPPGGAGKIRLQPNYQLSTAPGAVVLRNYEGVITRYTEPADLQSPCPSGCNICGENGDDNYRKGSNRGVSAVLQNGGIDELLPAGMQRASRRKKS